METLVSRFAEALKTIDASGEPYKTYRPGVGPYGEPQVIRKCLAILRNSYPTEFGSAKTKREPDVLIPGAWALEFKIVRPFGDNERPAEHWSENLLHPYEGNISALGDCLKLARSDCKERKGVLILTYEHAQPKVDLNVLIDSFELLATRILSIKLGRRAKAQVTDLIHPVHQCAAVHGWEILS